MAKTTYLWDPLSDNLLSEDDGLTSTTYTNEPTDFGGLVSQWKDINTNFYHFDARGDTRELTDASAVVTDTKLYDAWGNVLSSTGLTTMPFQFVGQFGYGFDAAVELSYVRARWYAPHISRWVSMDPLLFVDGINLFSYARLDPMKHIDASGTVTILNKPPTLADPKDRPVLRPEPVGTWPSPDEFQDRTAKCICKSLQGNRMRPTSPTTGQAPPVAGLPWAVCTLDEVVLVRYKSTCEPADDLSCKMPCEASICWEYVCYRCKSREVSSRSKYPAIKTKWGSCEQSDPRSKGGKVKCQL